MNMHRIRGLLTIVSLLYAFPTPAFALDWDIKNLGVLPGAVFSTGTGLNDLGQVTGEMNYGTIDDGVNRPFTTQYVYISGPNGGPLQLIDTSGVVPGISVYTASEINYSGQVIGTYLQGSSTNVGFTTNANGNGIQHHIGFARGWDINDSGTSVHQSTFGGAYVVAPNGDVNMVATDGEPRNIRGINNAGEVAISSEVWSAEDGFRPVSVNGTALQLYDINNSGQVLGSLLDDVGSPMNQSPLFVIDPDNTVHTLNITIDEQSALLGYSLLYGGFKLNDNGQVIGVIRDGQGTTAFSFLASIGTDDVINLSMEEDILAAGWSNITVSDINNLGQISGTGIIGGEKRAFLLTPVPEPETYAMMLAGLSMLGFMRRRKTVSA